MYSCSRVVRVYASSLVLLASGWVAAAVPIETVGPILEAPGTSGVPVHLMNCEFLQGGKPVAGEPIRIDPNLDLVIQSDWLAAVPMKSSAPVRVIIMDSLGLVSRTFNFRVGPERKSAPWGAGGVYSQTLHLALNESVQTFSGFGRVVVAVDLPGVRERAYEVAAAYSVVMAPQTREPRIAHDPLAARLGNEFTVIPVETTLSVGAELTVSVPDGVDGSYGSVGLISSLTYTATQQGTPVCEVTLIGETGELTLLVEAGVHTARCDIDAYPARTLGHEKIEVYESRDSAHVSRTGQPVQLYKFFSELPITRDIGKIHSIRLRCEAEVFFSIYGLVLVKK